MWNVSTNINLILLKFSFQNSLNLCALPLAKILHTHNKRDHFKHCHNNCKSIKHFHPNFPIEVQHFKEFPKETATEEFKNVQLSWKLWKK